jgi:hypothetical protein
VLARQVLYHLSHTQAHVKILEQLFLFGFHSIAFLSFFLTSLSSLLIDSTPQVILYCPLVSATDSESLILGSHASLSLSLQFLVISVIFHQGGSWASQMLKSSSLPDLCILTSDTASLSTQTQDPILFTASSSLSLAPCLIRYQILYHETLDDYGIFVIIKAIFLPT